jgi:3-oxoacyl-[acyl-carrier protein] reductase
MLGAPPARNVDLSGRIALVTGASRSIGRAIALELASAGADILVGYHSAAAAADSVVGQITDMGRRAISIAGDLGDPGTAGRLVYGCVAEFGGLDIVVNNAGVTYNGPSVDMDDTEWDRVMNANLNAPFRLIRAALPHLASSQSGRIINISSVSGQSGTAGAAAYSASKAGLIGLTRAIAREVAGDGITVNAIAPGWVDTDMTRDFPAEVLDRAARETPIGRLGTVREIATVAAFLASDAASYITGATISVNGGSLTA